MTHSYGYAIEPHCLPRRLPRIYMRNGYWICLTNMRMYPSLSDRATAWCAQQNNARP